MACIRSVAFLGFIVAGLATLRSVQSQCNSAALTACLQPFQVWSVGFALGTVTASNITAACASYNVTVTCVLYTANCPDNDPITMANWLGKKHEIGFACTTGLNDYLANQVCLASLPFLYALGGPGGCGQAGTGLANTSLSPADACISLSNSLNCIDAATLRTCNPSAQALMDKAAPLLLTPAIQAISPSCTGVCNITTLYACLAAFSSVSTGFSQSVYTASTLDGACSAYNTMVSCALNQANCSDNDAISMAVGWTGKKYIVGQICGPARAAYLANQPCLASQAFGVGLSACNTPIAAGQNPTFACNQINSQIACIGTVSNTICGQSAANFMLQTTPGYLGPSIKVNYPNCIVGAAAHWMNLSLLLASVIVALLI